MATLTVPRLRVIRARILRIDPGTEDPWVSINPCGEVKEQARRLKALFLVCRSARQEVLRTLPPRLRFATFMGVERPPRLGMLHFDAENDVLCLVSPSRWHLDGPPAPNIGHDFRLIRNLGLQVNFGTPPDEVLSSLIRGVGFALSMSWESLVCYQVCSSAIRFYIIAPPHLRNAPKLTGCTEISVGGRLEDRHGETDAEDQGTGKDGSEIGYLCSGLGWSNNSLLRPLQMSAAPGSFGKFGKFGLTRVPVQQVQHAYATDGGQDLTAALLSLWLSLCCRPDTDSLVRTAIHNALTRYRAYLRNGLSRHLQASERIEPEDIVRYCGVLVPMLQTYPLLKVYDGPVGRPTG